MGTALHALGLFCARWSLVMLGIWILIIGAVVGAVTLFGDETSNDLALPGTGSQEMKDLLDERFPPQQNGANPIVFHVESGKLTDKANKDAVDASVKALKQAPHVYSVTNPFSSAGETAGLLSKDKEYAFAPVLLDIGSGVSTRRSHSGSSIRRSPPRKPASRSPPPGPSAPSCPTSRPRAANWSGSSPPCSS